MPERSVLCPHTIFHQNFKQLKCTVVFFLCLFFVNPLSALSSSYQFPLYPEIRNNVFFWQQIYSTYSINTAVIHDKTDLSIIYTTVKLKSASTKNAASYNKRKIDAAKKRYRNLLLKLARNQSAGFGQFNKVKRLFPANATPRDFRKAADNIRAQRGLREHFQNGVKQSGAYMARIKAIFDSYNLPHDLAYLPHVESSFNLKAYSKHGAAGIWQFTRATGKQYLTINNAIDERKDPILAAHAAAKLLKDNYASLHDWPLALTAYNYGKAGMMRAQKANGSYQKIFSSYDKGAFKFASRNFYSEFLAAVYVAKKLERSNTLRLDKPGNTISFRAPADISLLKLCKHLNLSQDDIKRYNPALLSSVYKGQRTIPKDFVLRLPAAKVTRMSLRNIPVKRLQSYSGITGYYKVKRGDTALAVALKHNISLQQLIKANKLDKSARVYTGQTLKIPQSRKHLASNRNKSVKILRAKTFKKRIR